MHGKHRVTTPFASEETEVLTVNSQDLTARQSRDPQRLNLVLQAVHEKKMKDA